MCALRETKLKGKGEVMFGEVVGRVSGVEVGRAREGMALLLSGRLMRRFSQMEGGVIQAYVGLSEDRERQLGVYIGIWTG